MHRWLLDDDEESKQKKIVKPEVKETCLQILSTKNCQKSTQTSGRRLYSAVLQGLTADESCNKQEEQSPSKIAEGDDGRKQTILFDIFSTKKVRSDNAEKEKIDTANKEKCTSTWQSLAIKEGSYSRKKFDDAPKEQSEVSNLLTKITKEATYTTANSSSANSSNLYTSINSTNNYSNYATGAPTLPSCPYSNYHNHNLYNNYINNNYIINVCPNNSYVTPYSNNYYVNNQNTSRSVPQVIRQPFVSNAVHINQPMWYVQQKTSQAYYPVRNYHTQPFVYVSNPPPLRTTQRWTTPFLKTQTQPPCYTPPPPSPPPQAWGGIHGQNVHRNNSTQLISSTQQYYGYGYSREGNKNFDKTPAVGNFSGKQLSQCGKLDRNHTSLFDDQNDHSNVCSLANKASCSATCCPTPHGPDTNPDAENTNPPQDESCKAEEESCNHSEDNFSSGSSLSSDDLERQALEQYSASNESFYRELEQQAAEQYEESGNYMSPPNDTEFFGGLLIIDIFCYANWVFKDTLIYCSL